MPTPTHPIQLGTPDELSAREFEIVLRRLADDLAYGADLSRFVGSGLEYAQSRPYAPGDSIRQMDWRTSARKGQPFIKEYEAMKRVTTHLIVDTSASMATSSLRLSKLDLAIWLGSALGLVALRRLSPVAVHSGGQREIHASPSLSRAGLWQHLEPLRHKDFLESTQLGPKLQQLSVQADRLSLLLVLSDLHEEAITTALAQAAQRHDVIVLRMIDPAEVQPLRAGIFRMSPAEGTGSSSLAPRRGGFPGHDRRREELIQAGIDVLDVRTDQPFLSALRPFLGSRGRRARG